MTVSPDVHLPSLVGATAWLNSEPLGPAELRGRVVLVNFWTWTCINWLRQEPYVRAWSQAYGSDGLLVIGVHTPEFSFEHEIDGVRRAIEERAIDYPVAVDNDYAIWSAFANRYWPALYFVDADGIIRDEHFGEGRYEQSERVIQRLLGVEREPAAVEGVGVEAAADWDHLYTLETYLGYGRSGRAYHWMLDGEWTIEPESVVLDRAGGSITCRFHARDAHLVLSRLASEGRFRSACVSTVSRRVRRMVSTWTRTGPACWRTPACTSSCASTTSSASGRWRSRSSSPASRRTRSRSGSERCGPHMLN
jgi:thiol-disulfide isomerase/thioredoxin